MIKCCRGANKFRSREDEEASDDFCESEKKRKETINYFFFAGTQSGSNLDQKVKRKEVLRSNDSAICACSSARDLRHKYKTL